MEYRKLLSDSAVSGVRIGVFLLRGFITVPIVTKLLGSSAFGIWTTVVGIVQIFTTIGELHLSGSLIRYIRDEAAVANTLTLLTTSTVITTVLFWIVGFALAAHDAVPIPADLVLPAGALVGIQILLHYLVNYPRARNQVKFHEVILMLQLFAETVCLGAVLFVVQDLAAGLWALVGVDLLFLAVLAAKFLPGNVQWPTPGKFRKYLRFGLPMVPKELSERLLSHGDKLLIIVMMGPSAAGVYAAAYSVTSLLSEVGQLFDSTLYPAISKAWDAEEYAEIATLYDYFLRGYAVLSIPAVVGFTVVGPPLLRLVSTPSIAEQGKIIIPLLVVGFSLQGLQKALSFPIAAAERTELISLVTIIVVVLNLSLNVVLIPLFGLVGAAAATTVSYTLRTAWLFVIVDRDLDLRFPQTEAAIAGVGAAVMAASLIVLPPLSDVVTVVLYPLAGVVVYAVVVFTLGSVSGNGWGDIRHFINE